MSRLLAARHETELGSDAAPAFRTPRRAPRLADQLYEEILGQIVAGKLPTGARLPSETRLGAIFGVSRPVIREAISRLQADGLVATRHGAGTFVLRRPGPEFLRLAPIGSIADLMRCCEYRIAVEGEAAALAAERRTPEALAEIEAALAALDRVIERGEVGAEADNRFHVAIAKASQNELFRASLDALSSHIFAGMTVARNLTLGHSRERLLLVQDEHRRIVEAIRAGDAEEARRVMRQHIDNARARMLGDPHGLSPSPADELAQET
ncbi:GntR family transcriptional regulator [Aliidongia dinghuensis]|uniref:GntR family transcriptional regulator n=1 Tax=Aliidongia dinghuensis TaxID=1867774 RepID=A0A8J2YR96_9PROT|nr:FadR/GntR family transcriptional regulator [Aliidongia dinghuensis]GGF10387.1 GntR family transcriptional regulator [Aliidongia dinghuensis]